MGKIEDHYVAQTYLKWFNDQQGKLWVYNKQWINIKSRTSAQICKEAGGSDNPYLQKDRAIEDYLKVIENNWNGAIKLFASSGTVDFQDYLEAKYIIAGYIAYLRFHTPAAVRTQQDMLEAQVKTEIKLGIKMGKIPPPPEIIKDIEKDTKVDVDGKFPKAIAAGVLLNTTETMFRSPWLRIENNSDIPFITSDNPLCLWYVKSSPYPMTYLPLTPKIAVLIKPFIHASDRESYDHSADESPIAKPEFITELNELVIKSAEKMVISNQKSAGLLESVRLLKDWHYGCVTQKIPIEHGELLHNKWGAIRKNS